MRDSSVHAGEMFDHVFGSIVGNDYPSAPSSRLLALSHIMQDLNVTIFNTNEGGGFPSAGKNGCGRRLAYPGGRFTYHFTPMPFSWPEGETFNYDPPVTAPITGLTVPGTRPYDDGYHICVLHEPATSGTYVPMWKYLRPLNDAVNPISFTIANWASETVRFVLTYSGTAIYDSEVPADTVEWLDLSAYTTDPSSIETLLCQAYIEDAGTFDLFIRGINAAWTPKNPHMFAAYDHYTSNGVYAQLTVLPWDRQIDRY